MEGTEGKLNIKITQLLMAAEKTDSVLETNNPEAIERHHGTLKTITADVSQIRIAVEEKKLEEKEDVADFLSLNTDIDRKLERADSGGAKVLK